MVSLGGGEWGKDEVAGCDVLRPMVERGVRSGWAGKKREGRGGVEREMAGCQVGPGCGAGFALCFSS